MKNNLQKIYKEVQLGNYSTFRREALNVRENIVQLDLSKFSLSKKERIIVKFLVNKKYFILYLTIFILKVFKVKSPIKRIYFSCLKKTYQKYVGADQDQDNNKIYMFHNISTKETNPTEFVSNKNGFEKFIQKQVKEAKPQSIENILENINGKNFAITFDDGFKGVYQYAYPVLKKYRVPFVVFVTTGYIGKAGYLNNEELLLINQDELCTIGAHTVTHPSLRKSRHSKEEMKQSKKELEELLHQKVEYFAYPYGSMHTCRYRNIKEAEKAGFVLACSAINGSINKRAKKMKYFLPRIDADYCVKEIEER